MLLLYCMIVWNLCLIIVGSHVLHTITLSKEVEIAAVENKSVIVTANSESFLIRLSSAEGTVFTLCPVCELSCSHSMFNKVLVMFSFLNILIMEILIIELFRGYAVGYFSWQMQSYLKKVSRKQWPKLKSRPSWKELKQHLLSSISRFLSSILRVANDALSGCIPWHLRDVIQSYGEAEQFQLDELLMSRLGFRCDRKCALCRLFHQESDRNVNESYKTWDCNFSRSSTCIDQILRIWETVNARHILCSHRSGHTNRD